MAEITIDQALQKAIEAHKAGQVHEADRLYTAILQAQPKHPDANHNMGVLAVGVGKVEQALPFFKTALEANPATAQFWLSYIDGLIKLGKLADAQAVLYQAKSKGAKGDGFDKLEQRLKDAEQEPLEANQIASEPQPKQSNILDTLKLDQAIKLAKKKSKEGSAEEAKLIYQDILTKFPKNKRASDGLKGLAGKTVGKASKDQNPPQEKMQSLLDCYSQGQLKQALAQATTLLQQFPNSNVLHNICGVVYKGLGQLDASVVAYKHAISIKPNYEAAHYNMGIALQEQGKLEKAMEAYRKALSIKPDYAEAHNNMGNALKEQGKLEEAIAAYKRALAIKPGDANFYNNMGVPLQELGKLEEAIEAYKNSLVIKPNHAEAYNNTGNALKEQGKLEKAMEAYRQALSIKPDYAEAYNNMGNTLKDLGKAEEAIEAYNKTLSLDPNNLEAAANLAILLFEAGFFEEAVELFSKNNSIKNQSYVLKCFYELDERSRFYNKLDYLIEKGENNCVIGSYASRAEIRYGIRKNNPFCNDPLKYVLKTDLSQACDFKKVFIENATNVLTNDEVKHKFQGHLKNGIQTAGNIFTQAQSFTNQWQDIIHSELTKYRDHFSESEEGLIKGWPERYNIYGWLVSMKNGGELSPHIHDTGWITGSIYINVPPKSKKDSGNLVVSTYDTNSETSENATSQSIDVVTGNLCLFPSSLLHYTIPFKSDEDRIVLAFDMIPAQ